VIEIVRFHAWHGPCEYKAAEPNRKEAEMNKPTYEDYLANPSAVLEQLEREAHRARAEAVHHFIVAPLMRLFKRAPEPMVAAHLDSPVTQTA
jgi:hypothetical protein